MGDYSEARKIKFRAWNKRKRRMFSVHDFGNYKEHSSLVYISDGHPDANFIGDDRDIMLMQYTGLNDRWGGEVYEGDIVETATGHKFRIGWNDATGAWALDGLKEMVDKLPDGSWFPEYRYFEVIGNIYENPELLKS